MRGYDSLAAQTFKDFEILCYHDGPLLDTEDAISRSHHLHAAAAQ